MQEQITLSKLKEDLIFFNKMYDVVRLVDPVRKKVLEYRGQQVEKTSETCHDYWKNGHICDNCISVRAHFEDKSYIKLEQNSKELMLVTAIPIEAEGEAVVLELLKNATDSMLMGTGNYNEGEMMYDVVSNMNNMVVRDQLTSIYNRRFVDDRLPVDIVNATVEQKPLSVIFIDMDNMKAINDTFGHLTGDLALKQVADAIKDCIRVDIDWVARYGGDEFIVCLSNVCEEEATGIAEEIRRRIASIEISVQDEIVRTTASLGVQTMFRSQLTAKEIIHMADKKMYQEKIGGKEPKETEGNQENVYR